MSRFNAAVEQAAQKFSIDDGIAIAEVLISVIKECQARRNANPQAMREAVASGGLVARISLRRAFRNRGFSIREAAMLTNEAIDLAKEDDSLISEALELAQEVV